MLVLVGVVAGCSMQPRTLAAASDKTLPRSSTRHYDRDGETVTLRLIPMDEWEALGVGKLPAPVDKDRFFGEAASLAGAAVGAVVDIVQAELKKEAARHTQQYSAFLYADDFWDKKSPRYGGFEIRRETTAYGHVPADAEGDACEARPAFRLVCAFVPSRHEPRLFLIRPVFLQVNSAKAKVSPSGRAGRVLTIEARTLIEAMAIDDKGNFFQREVADALLKVPGYSLETSRQLTSTYSEDDGKWTGPLASQVAGYFMAPIASGDGGQSGGAFRLALVVTETDDSRAQKTLLQFSDFVGEQRERVVEVVKGAIDGDGKPTGP
jgi:hypothetical protein